MMNKRQLAEKIMRLIDEERTESIHYQMATQWRTRGEVLAKIQTLCFREALNEDNEQDQRRQKPDVAPPFPATEYESEVEE